jgi:hypothetical protein
MITLDLHIYMVILESSFRPLYFRLALRRMSRGEINSSYLLGAAWSWDDLPLSESSMAWKKLSSCSAGDSSSVKEDAGGEAAALILMGCGCSAPGEGVLRREGGDWCSAVPLRER